MTAETIQAKAVRYLNEGRLAVRYARGGRIIAECQGTERYELGRATGRWSCSCPARGDCCHLVALRLVVGALPRSES